MSRSNPNENSNPNPASRWFEWNGETGEVRYYDKESKQNEIVGADFSFILLDQLGSVRGWHDPTESGIYSNEVKDTTRHPLIVKAFKGGTLAEGLYRDIKDKIKAQGGQFVANCYIAFQENGSLKMGSLRLKGSALNVWSEFCKANRADLYKKAIRINGFTEGKKGRIVYRTPVLSLVELEGNQDAEALQLDQKLQEYLKSYFNVPTRQQSEPVTDAMIDNLEPPPHSDADAPSDFGFPGDDEIPF